MSRLWLLTGLPTLSRTLCLCSSKAQRKERAAAATAAVAASASFDVPDGRKWCAFLLRTAQHQPHRGSTRTLRVMGSMHQLLVTADMSKTQCDPPLHLEDSGLLLLLQVAATPKLAGGARKKTPMRTPFASMHMCVRRSSQSHADLGARKSSGWPRRRCIVISPSRTRIQAHFRTK